MATVLPEKKKYKKLILGIFQDKNTQPFIEINVFMEMVCLNFLKNYCFFTFIPKSKSS